MARLFISMVSQSPTVTGGNGSREAWWPGYSSVWCPRAPPLPVVMVPGRLGGQAIHQYGVPEPHRYRWEWFQRGLGARLFISMVSQSPTVTGGNGSREAWWPGYSSVWCPRAPLLPVGMVPERLGSQAIHQYGVPEPHRYRW